MKKIETTLHTRAPEADNFEQTPPYHSVRDSLVVGLHPFLEDPHNLILTTGIERRIWHDGSSWRVEKRGWDTEYADRIIEWGALDDLDPQCEYKIQASDSVVILREA